MTDAARHVGWALLAPVLDPASRTFAPALLVGALVALGFTAWTAPGPALLTRAWALGSWLHPSARLDVQVLLANRLVRLLSAVPGLGGAWWIATSLVRWLDRTLGVPSPPELPALAVSAAVSLVLFLAWDLSRYLLHRLMHAVPALWAFHQVHHSAEVLTPLTYHRVHPIEAALYDVRGALVTGVVSGAAFWLYRGQAVELTLFGVHGLSVVANAALGNLRHSHIWMRFPPAVERWLLSPAQHQLHHAIEPWAPGNYGVWLAVWDRVGGTLRLAGPRPPSAFGVREANHHPHDLVSALFGPLRVGLGRRAATALAVVVSGRAAAEAPSAETDLDVIIVRDEGVPRVAGSAHVIDAEELERYEYDDIHRVLGKVPGVYVRGEDGFGLRPNIGIRGANSDRSAKVTLLEDGVPLAPAPYAAPAAYYFPMATRLVGVEVFKGPAATRHGPQTVGGAINLLTRDVPTAPTAYVDLAAGLRTTLKGHGYAGVGGPRAGLLVEASHLQSDGFKRLDGGGPTGFDRQDVMLKARLGDAPGGARRHTVDAKLGYGRERSNETYLGLTAEDLEADPYRRYRASARDHMQWGRTQAELSWSARIGEAFDVRTVAYHHLLARAWTKLNRFAGGPDLHGLLQSPVGGQADVYLGILKGTEDGVTADQVLRIGTNDRTFRSFGLQSVAHHRARGEVLSSALEVGVRLHADHVVRLHTEDPFDMRQGDLVATGGPTEVLLDSVSVAQALAAHVHDDLAVGRFHVLPGARVEVVRTAAGTPAVGPRDPQLRVVPLPGVGLLAEVAPWLDVFGGVHRGFSPVAPGLPAETRPETSTAWELGVRAAGGPTHAEVVGFISDYDNITGQCTLSGGCTDDQLDQQFNGGAAWVGGFESVLSQEVRLGRGVSLTGEGAYTATHTAFRTGFVSEYPQFGTVEVGDALPYVPSHQGSIRGALAHPRGSVSVAGVGRSGMRDVAGQGALADTDVPGAFVLDAAAAVQLAEAVEAYVTATNLTNAVVLESWRPFGARPAAPLQVMIGVKGRL